MAPRYAELHCHSNFSFLDGASHPHDLVSRAAELGYEAIAVTDHDGFYGAPRFRIAAAELGGAAVYGTDVGCPRGKADSRQPTADSKKAPGTRHQSSARTRPTEDRGLETDESGIGYRVSGIGHRGRTQRLPGP